jgi:hypothetical protein
VGIELVFEKNTSCKAYLSTWRKPPFIAMAYSADWKKHVYLSKDNHPS